MFPLTNKLPGITFKAPEPAEAITISVPSGSKKYRSVVPESIYSFPSPALAAGGVPNALTATYGYEEFGTWAAG
jgi:hypothetical protein